jgi:alpha-ketoglutarate-dependent taurine dioxygenase
MPYSQRPAAGVDAWFGRDKFHCLDHDSPAVLTVGNIGNAHAEHAGTSRIIIGGSWHTDIEYEPVPMHVSMFLVQKVPRMTARKDGKGENDEEGEEGEEVEEREEGEAGEAGEEFDGSPKTTWIPAEHVTNYDKAEVLSTIYDPDSSDGLMNARMLLPLNGETCFADTVAALAALPAEEQLVLEKVMVRRRLNEGDDGWLAPLVRVDARTGVKGLHSPFWNSRPRVRPSVEVDGLTAEESRAFLDRLEEHCLQPQFRYDHAHAEGDVTIWHNYLSIHNAPPMLVSSRDEDDMRVMFRMSCKGPPCFELPRTDASSWIEEHICPPYVSPHFIGPLDTQ